MLFRSLSVALIAGNECGKVPMDCKMRKTHVPEADFIRRCLGGDKARQEIILCGIGTRALTIEFDRTH